MMAAERGSRWNANARLSLRLTVALALALGLLAISTTTLAAELDLPVLWQIDVETKLENASTAADIDGDGVEEIIIAGLEEIIILNGQGEQMVRWRGPGRFMSYPSLLERPGHVPLTYIGDNKGWLTCLDARGEVAWQKQVNGVIGESAAVVCDLQGDGTMDVVQTDSTGVVWVFDALTGDVQFKSKVSGHAVSPALGDLDGDGHPELVISSGNGVVYALDGDGSLMWEYKIGGSSLSWSTSAAVIFAMADGGIRVMAASADGEVFCFDGAGQVLWRRRVRGPVASGISVGDMDQDGCADIFVVTQLGVIYRFGEDGRVIWDIDMQRRSLAAGAIVDVNGDGQLEYVLASQNGHLMILNEAGEFLFEHRYEWRTINMTPSFADVSAVSPGLEMIVTCNNGDVFCYATKAPAAPEEQGAPGQWMMYRCDRGKTGAWFGLVRNDAISMAPTNLAWDQVFTGESVRFVIHNPNAPATPSKSTALSASAVCIKPDGSRLAARSSVIGERGELLLPIDVLVPGTYRFTWALNAPDGRSLFSGARDVPLLPFVNDRALVRRTADALHTTADFAQDALPLSASALRREATALESRAEAVEPLQSVAPGGGAAAEQETLDQTSALVAEARRALAVSECVRDAVDLGPGTSLVAFEGALWDNRGVDRQLPSGAANPLAIARKLVPGEHDSIAIDLFNVTDRELNVRVRIEGSDGAPTVTTRAATSVPTVLGGVAWDPLPKLNESAVVTIPSLSSREVWLEANVQGTHPGKHSLTVTFEALDGAGVLAPKNPQMVPAPETRVDIALEVLPFEMAPSGAYRLCTWAAPEERYIDDLIEHGNNVFIVPHGNPDYDAENNLLKVDYTELDEDIAIIGGADVVLLIHGVPAVKVESDSAEYLPRMKAYLDDLVPHLADQGLDTEHFALYAADEPGGHGMDTVDFVVAFAKAVRAINPDLMLYVNGGGSVPMFEKMGPYTDVWCPGLGGLTENNRMMEIIRSTGKMIWSYNCGYSHARPIGPNIKDINIIAEYRVSAIFVLRHGASGGGFWCYNSNKDMWSRIKNEYRLVYEGQDGPITTRRWEGVRESIDDYRILVALRERLDNGKLGEATQARIRGLLDVHMPGLLDEGYTAMKMGLARDVLDAAYSEDKMVRFRNEMMACVGAVCEEAGK
jgi:outer membrane protein assembly factor BamB